MRVSTFMLGVYIVLACFLTGCHLTPKSAFWYAPETSFEDATAGFEFCPSGNETQPTLGKYTTATCPPPADVKSVLDTITHKELVSNSNTIIIMVPGYIQCDKVHEAIGCENNQVIVVKDDPRRWCTLRHELTHASLEKQGLPPKDPGDTRHTMLIWKIVDACDMDNDPFEVLPTNDDPYAMSRH